jgi:hypothetical protein
MHCDYLIIISHVEYFLSEGRFFILRWEKLFFSFFARRNFFLMNVESKKKI